MKTDIIDREQPYSNRITSMNPRRFQCNTNGGFLATFDVNDWGYSIRTESRTIQHTQLMPNLGIARNGQYYPLRCRISLHLKHFEDIIRIPLLGRKGCEQRMRFTSHCHLGIGCYDILSLFYFRFFFTCRLCHAYSCL